MKLVDSHCHLDDLDLSKYDGNLDKVIDVAKENGVETILNACADLKDFPKILEIVARYAHVWASLGVHPSIQCNPEPTVEELVKLASHKKVIAIGECGLDYHYDDTDPKVQKERFRRHIEVVKITEKPLMIHTREANEDTLAILRTSNIANIRGVVHCFTSNWDWAQQYLDLGFYIGITGIVTFKKADEIREVAKNVPLDRLLIETDAPYLAPVPHRGKPNEPAYVRYVAETIAGLRNISVEELAKTTTDNFHRLFQI